MATTITFDDDVRDGYRKLFETAKVRPERKAFVQSRVAVLAANKNRYHQAGGPLGVPWWFVAILHELESGADFSTHLHNGDPLTHKTVNVPAGRPPGNPPFTWLRSARDALRFDRVANVQDWSISHALFRFEGFNGFGYRSRGINSPYLWSFSNKYTKGKFVADGVFDPNAVSEQCGAAVLLREMVNQDLGEPTVLDHSRRVQRPRLTSPRSLPPRSRRAPGIPAFRYSAGPAARASDGRRRHSPRVAADGPIPSGTATGPGTSPRGASRTRRRQAARRVAHRTTGCSGRAS